MSHWHYQLMWHEPNTPDFEDDGYYAIHEYFEREDGDGWTESPVTVEGDSIEDVKKVLMLMLHDIDKHGVKNYE
ncbi:hypothetical protein N9Z41_02685 [bacterium]|nr:hypothetical protein [bacterium]